MDLESNKLKPNTIQVSRMEVAGREDFTKVKSENMGAAVYLLLTSDGKNSTTHIDVAELESLHKGIPHRERVISPTPKHLVVGNLGAENCFEHDFNRGGDMLFKGKTVKSIMVEGGLELRGDHNTATLPAMTVVLKEPEVAFKFEVGFIRLECKPPAKVRRSFRPMPGK
jgi:hypothetical protein